MNAINCYFLQITNSLRQYGINDNVSAYYIVEVVHRDESSKMPAICEMINGRFVDLSNSPNYSNDKEIKQVSFKKNLLILI